MAEIFDASGAAGMGDSGAQSLANALSALASPLDDIARNTRITADNSKDLRSNPTLEDFFNPTSGPTFPRMAGSAGPAKPSNAKSPLGANALAALAESGRFKMDMGALGGAAASRRAAVTGTIPMANRMPAPMATVTGTVMGPTAAKLTAAFAGISTAATAVAAPLLAVAGAGIAAAAGLGATVAIARHFTQAFDPSTVLVFDAAMKDLNAVIGSMLVPIVDQASRVVRAFASHLYSGTNLIMPAIKSIAKAVGDIFIAFMPVVGQATKLFADLLVVVAGWAKTVADFVVPHMRALVVVMAGFGQAFKSIISSLFPTLGGNFKNALITAAQTVSKMAVAFTAVTFRLLGMTGSLDAMMASLSPAAIKGRDAGGLAAAVNAKLVGVGSLGNEVLQRAFTTSGRAGKSDEELADEQYRKDLMELVANIKGFNLKALPQMIADAIVNALRGRTPSPTEAMAPVNPPRQTGGGRLRDEANAFVSAWSFGLL